LLRDEGIRLKPYRDTVGKLTIGVGRNLDDKGISRDEAMELLDNDITEVTLALNARLPWTTYLHGPRHAALVNLAFNMGIGGLLEFKKMLGAFKAEKWDVAAKELLDSKYATQVGARANRLAEQLKTGVMQ
jgi:lysozyme